MVIKEVILYVYSFAVETKYEPFFTGGKIFVSTVFFLLKNLYFPDLR